jgi:hypothetical protein
MSVASYGFLKPSLPAPTWYENGDIFVGKMASKLSGQEGKADGISCERTSMYILVSILHV